VTVSIVAGSGQSAGDVMNVRVNIPAAIESWTIPDWVKGASEGEGLAQVPHHIRGGGTPSFSRPIFGRPGHSSRRRLDYPDSANIETVTTELVLADLEAVKKAPGKSRQRTPNAATNRPLVEEAVFEKTGSAFEYRKAGR